MCCDGDNNGFDKENCVCLPFKDPLLITAQALSVVAWCLSFGYWVSILLGLAAMIMLCTAFCCRMNKCGFITAAVFGLIAALGTLIVGGVLIANSDDFTCTGGGSDSCETLGAVAIVGGLLWIASATLVLIFIGSGRLDKCNADSPAAATPAVATPVAAKSTAEKTADPEAGGPVPTETRTTITEQPDGTRKIEKETIHPDGSRTIETTYEKTE